MHIWMFACKSAEKHQMHIFDKCKYETYQMHTFGKHSNAYAEVSIHISDECILHICWTCTCKYAQKLLLTNAHIEYAEKCQMHIFDESSYANTQSVKCI